MPRVTWERGVMRWWAAITLPPAVFGFVLLLLMYNTGRHPLPIQIFGAGVVALAVLLAVSYVGVRVVVWVIKGWIGPPDVPRVR